MLFEFLKGLPAWLYVLIISVLPFIELRGAIPVGAALGMPFYANFLISLLGNMLPVPFVLIFIPRILDFLGRGKLFRPMVEWLRRKADKHSKRVIKCGNTESDTTLEEAKVRQAIMNPAIFFALFMFVALPLPGTGAWSGALVAALFSLSKKYAFLAILLGVITCGIIMTLASYGMLEFLSFLL